MQSVLNGIKVLEMSVAAAGPSCTKFLAETGAECIMIEPLEGQSTRNSSKHSFDFKTSGKKSLALNLKTDKGKAILSALITKSDVFISNYRMKSLTKLGLDYESLSRINKRIIYAHLSGFGTCGPQRDDAGFEATAWWGQSGLLLDAAQKDSIIQMPFALGDYSTGMALAAGIGFALYNRERTGLGTQLSTSLLATGLYLNADAIIESQYGRHLPLSRTQAPRPLQNTYKCKDGIWISINANRHWESAWPCLCTLLNCTELLDKYSCPEDTLKDNEYIIHKFDIGFSQITSEDACTELLQAQVSVSVPQHSIDAARDIQAIENDYIYEWRDDDNKLIMIPALPIHIGDEFAPKIKHGPSLSENSKEILSELGYTDNDIKSLIDENITK